jgi:hypothetical protein
MTSALELRGVVVARLSAATDELEAFSCQNSDQELVPIHVQLRAETVLDLIQE